MQAIPGRDSDVAYRCDVHQHQRLDGLIRIQACEGYGWVFEISGRARAAEVARRRVNIAADVLVFPVSFSGGS